jgi:hypothetical protein
VSVTAACIPYEAEIILAKRALYSRPKILFRSGITTCRSRSCISETTKEREYDD